MLLLASELKASEARLKLEQAKRTEKEKARIEKEKAINDRRKEREKERELEQQRLRMAAETRRQQELDRIEALTELNQGVFYQASLQALPLDERTIATKGIRRAEDKICLPPTAGSQLINMDAMKNGSMFFELKTPGGSVTHAGLLEFNAPEGTVLVPRKVLNCLYGSQPSSLSDPSAGTMSSSSGLVSCGIPSSVAATRVGGGGGGGGGGFGPLVVTYKKLVKGSFVRFQPLQRGFHEAVDLSSSSSTSSDLGLEGGERGGGGGGGRGMREVLEGALMKLTCLSKGDIVNIFVPHPTTNMNINSKEDKEINDLPPAADEMDVDDAIREKEEEGEKGERGAWHQLLVQELEPTSAVSLIDTNMEAQVIPSLEAEEALRRIEAERAVMEERRREREREALQAMRAEQEAALERAELEKLRRIELSSWLPPEPPSSSPPLPPSSLSPHTSESTHPSNSTIIPSAAPTAPPSSSSPSPPSLFNPINEQDEASMRVQEVVFRLPDGSRVTRRFYSHHPAWLLFLFLDSLGAGGLAPGRYRLVMNYPRRVIEPLPYDVNKASSSLSSSLLPRAGGDDAGGREGGGGGGGDVTLSIATAVRGMREGLGEDEGLRQDRTEVMVLEPIHSILP